VRFILFYGNFKKNNMQFSKTISKSLLFIYPRGRYLLKEFINLRDNNHEELLIMSQDELLDLISSNNFEESEIFSVFNSSINMFSFEINNNITHVSYLIWLYKSIYNLYPEDGDWNNQLNNWKEGEKIEFIKNIIIPVI
jgi:hypothetical protein